MLCHLPSSPGPLTCTAQPNFGGIIVNSDRLGDIAAAPPYQGYCQDLLILLAAVASDTVDDVATQHVETLAV